MARMQESTAGRGAAGSVREGRGPGTWFRRRRARREEPYEHRLGHQLDYDMAHDPNDADWDVGMGEPVRARPRIARLGQAIASSSRRAARRLRELPGEVEMPEPKAVATFAAFAGVTAAAAYLGTRAYPAHRLSRTRLWYRTLDKPAFNPPDWVFGPVWSVLYALIATSGYRVWRARDDRQPRTRSAALALWAAQLGLNAAWTPIFFGARRPRLALADLGALIAAVGGYTMLARKVDRPAAMLMAPYLAWLTFAGVINEEIVRRNG